MEALAVFSVACNAIQVIDFSCKLALKAYDVYTLGTSEQNAALEEDTSKLSEMITFLDESITSLGSTTVPLTKDDRALHELGMACARSARDLQRMLTDVRPTDGRKRHRSGKAIKSIWTDSKIQDLREKLDRQRKTLEGRILVDLRKRVIDGNILATQRFNDLDSRVKILLTGLADGKTKLEDFAYDLSKLCRDEHTATRATISIAASEICDHVTSTATAHHSLLEQQTLDIKNELLPSAHDQILQSLAFPEMLLRQEQVAEAQAHQKTFHWVFDKVYMSNKDKPGSSHRNRWDSLGLWLENGNHCYWISGKAGSGKSTLMNHVWNAVETEQALKRWAGGAHLITPRYFFYNPGSPLQKSANGLLRALVYQVLEANPDLTPIFMTLLSKHQIAAVENQRGFNLSWSDGQLTLLLLKLANNSAKDTWACFFIDGLDEFEGDRGVLLETVKSLADMPNIKVCVSSRPWPIFEEALRQKPKLKLQDLTYDCIKGFVFAKLEASLYKRYGVARGPKRQIENLLNGITEKASGVFLWVSLVVRDILEGLPSGDTFEHLERRIDGLPEKLDLLFEHMLARIQPVYREEFNDCLSIFKHTRKYRRGKLEFVTLALATWKPLHKSNSTNFLALDREDAHDHVKSLEKGFAARTAGLLELVPFKQLKKSAMRASDVRLQLSQTDNGEDLVQLTSSDLKTYGSLSVEAIHRSVVDFFDQRGTTIGWLCLRSNEVTAEWLLKGSILNYAFRYCIFWKEDYYSDLGEPYHDIYQSVIHARELDAEFCIRHEEILDAYGNFLQRQSSDIARTLPYGREFSQRHLNAEFPGLEGVRLSTDFSGLVTQLGLTQYPLAKLYRHRDAKVYATYLLKCASVYYFHSSRMPNQYEKRREIKRVAHLMIRLLRDHGADPLSPFECFDPSPAPLNESGQIIFWTAWTFLIRSRISISKSSTELYTEFIKAGVHNDVRCRGAGTVVLRPYRDKQQLSRSLIAEAQKSSQANAEIELDIRYSESPSLVLAVHSNLGADSLAILDKTPTATFQLKEMSVLSDSLYFHSSKNFYKPAYIQRAKKRCNHDSTGNSRQSSSDGSSLKRKGLIAGVYATPSHISIPEEDPSSYQTTEIDSETYIDRQIAMDSESSSEVDSEPDREVDSDLGSETASIEACIAQAELSDYLASEASNELGDYLVTDRASTEALEIDGELSDYQDREVGNQLENDLVLDTASIEVGEAEVA